jgi:ribosomal protein L35AE/L33A
MASTLLLDTQTWDLLLDVDGNIAVASEPYSLAQDAASVIRTYLGEVYFDTTIGIPYLQQVFGRVPSLTLLKAQIETAAETVPDVTKATVFLTSTEGRIVTGQIQVTSAQTGQVSAATFTVIDPQGVG